jgi:hypothetical protein
MWIVTTRAQLQPDGFAAAAESYASLVAPRIASTPGGVGGILLLSDSARAAESVSYWPDLERMRSGLRPEGTLLEEGWLAGAVRPVPSCYRVVFVRRARPLVVGSCLRSIEVACGPSGLDGCLHHVQGTIEPAVRSLPGFRSLFCGIDDADGRVIVSISWDTARDMTGASLQIEAHERTAIAAAQAESVTVETSILAALASGEPD